MSEALWKNDCEKQELGRKTAAPSIEDFDAPLQRISESTEAESNGRQTVIENKAKEHGQTLQPTPCEKDEQSSDEEFIHGFLAGCVLIGSLAACGCRGKPTNQVLEEVAHSPSLDEEHSAKFYNDMKDGDGSFVPSEGDFNSFRDDAGETGLKALTFSPPTQFVSGPPIYPPASKSVIAHIPRPKPVISSSSSPLIS